MAFISLRRIWLWKLSIYYVDATHKNARYVEAESGAYVFEMVYTLSGLTQETFCSTATLLENIGSLYSYLLVFFVEQFFIEE